MANGSQEIEANEQARRIALLTGDLDKLDRLISDRLLFVHPTGNVDTKAEFLAALSRRNPYLSIDVIEQNILMLDKTAVVAGELSTLVRRDPPEQHVTQRTRILCVWTQEDGDWRLVRYQSGWIGMRFGG
ncbi:nuclear transport factor 2 family protein [Sphingobium sp. SCG-1]|uniref:nuclear transport factor 2 family protein n=1 Tax=Sphingobium sp. SCG-1 TaxID=2072936 RepID=UPI00166FF50F|nr:nuclear transport factor 2 family protein [Sphingobium sp. SCG-1]